MAWAGEGGWRGAAGPGIKSTMQTLIHIAVLRKQTSDITTEIQWSLPYNGIRRNPSAQACPENMWCAPRKLQKKKQKSDYVGPRKKNEGEITAPRLGRACGCHEVGCGQEQR